MVMTLACAKAPFAQGCQVGVIANACRHAKVFLKFRANRKIFPARDIGRRENYAGFGVERTGQGA